MNRNQEITADFEQLETEVVNAARVVASYYKELRRGGLPLELIDRLTIDFTHQWWTGSLGLNEQHVFMHSDIEDDEE